MDSKSSPEHGANKVIVEQLTTAIFASLSDESREAVVSLFQQQGKSSLAELFEKETLSIFRNRIPLREAVATKSNRLAEINPASFKFLSQTQKLALEEELLFAFYIFSAQYHLDETEGRKSSLEELSHKIFLCSMLISALNFSAKAHSPETMLRELRDQFYGTHCKYLGLSMGYKLGEAVHEFTGGQAVAVRNFMNDINERRLYWVWGEGMTASILSVLPETMAQRDQAQFVLTRPDYYLGTLSWSLYYARFGLNLSLLLKHTLQGPWMSKREKEHIPAGERFLTQWNQRKYTLLNDLVWATVNLVTFAWLVGSGMLGYWGNALTVGLLLVDASLTIWRIYEESTRFNKEMLQYQQELVNLNSKIDKASGDEKEKLEHHKKRLMRTIKERTLDWKYQKYRWSLDLTYSVSLVVGFFVACAFLIPPGILVAPTALVIMLAGAAICFALTVAYSAVSGFIDILHSKAKGKTAKEECLALLEEFKGSKDESYKKLLYLEIKRLTASSEHSANVVSFQKKQVIRAVFIDLMIPALVLTTLLFLPLPIGLGVLAAGFALAALSGMLLNRYKPKEGSLPEFDEGEYQAFLKNPTIAPVKSSDTSITSNGLFSGDKRSDSNDQSTEAQSPEDFPNGVTEPRL
ncbi:hypothetical protein [Legionella impletisoli]|uniref:Coiled-coil protein n=1 Tax=Legionella impletisoli TaxID=343510 RepID=A0A917JU98_9GAMM|nr:hypothetical protein [Legionella impletisoli]GGI86906.1 hypothetical protein GCM10007966_14470 [Legionella impletisoli]